LPTGISVVDTTNFAIAPGGDHCSGTVVHAGAGCAVDFLFSPTAPHAWESRLNMTGNAAIFDTYFISGLGTQGWAGMAPSLDFGSVEMGNSTVLAIPVRNIGTGALHVTGAGSALRWATRSRRRRARACRGAARASST
jgi:hypothetical protein